MLLINVKMVNHYFIVHIHIFGVFLNWKLLYVHKSILTLIFYVIFLLLLFLYLVLYYLHCYVAVLRQPCYYYQPLMDKYGNVDWNCSTKNIANLPNPILLHSAQNHRAKILITLQSLGNLNISNH